MSLTSRAIYHGPRVVQVGRQGPGTMSLTSRAIYHGLRFSGEWHCGRRNRRNGAITGTGRPTQGGE